MHGAARSQWLFLRLSVRNAADAVQTRNPKDRSQVWRMAG